MSVTVPLSVRIRTQARDIHVTGLISDIVFSTKSPGGYDSLTMDLHRPLKFTPGEVALFANVYVYAATGLVWEGRLQDPGRTAGSEGEVYSLTAIGGQAHLSDREVPYILVDSSFDRFEPTQTSSEHPMAAKRVDEDHVGNPGIWITAQPGQTWAANNIGTMMYPHIRRAGQAIGAYGFQGDCGRDSSDWKWQTVTRSPAGVGTIDRNVNFAIAGVSSSQREVITSFPDGDDQLEIRIQNASGGSLSPNDQTWAVFSHFYVICKLVDTAGVDKTVSTGYDYEFGWILASEVIEDMIGRLLPEISAEATVTTTSFQIEQLAYPGGVTPAKVLEDLIGFEPAYTWHVWGSDANGQFLFEWIPWPTSVRYEADALDGFSAPASGNTLFSEVRVQWTDAKGKIRHITRTQAVPALDDNGLRRIGFIDLGSEAGTSALAVQAGDQFLAEHRFPTNAGRLTISRPILDITGSRMVQPWEIRAGQLIRVRGVESYPDSLNASERDGLTVFKIAATSYNSADNSITLDLDTYAPDVARSLAQLAKKTPNRWRR